MSPEHFSRLTDQYPDQAPVWEELSGWARSHRGVQFLEARRLGTLLKNNLHLGAGEASHILSLIFDSGLFTQMYAVISPRGHACGPWMHLDDIPAEIEEGFLKFDADEGDVVPVLVEVPANAQPA